MDIISNIKLAYNKTTISNFGDYIKTYFAEYFGYEYDSDIVVNLYTLFENSSEYNLFERYREMIEDQANVNSGYLRYIELTESKSSYGRRHSMAKNLLYQGWRELGCYFTWECRQRFKAKNKFAFDLIIGRIQNGLDISQYKTSFKSIIEYIEILKETINVNSYSFFNGVTRKFWFALEDVDVRELSSRYKIKVYLPKSKNSASLLFKSYTSTYVPKNNFYKLELF